MFQETQSTVKGNPGNGRIPGPGRKSCAWTTQKAHSSGTSQRPRFQEGEEPNRRRTRRSPGPLTVGEAQVKTKCAAASRPFQQQKSAGARTRRNGALAGCWWGAEALPESAEGVLATANKASPQEPGLSFRVCARRAGTGTRGQLRPGSQRRGSRERDPEATCVCHQVDGDANGGPHVDGALVCLEAEDSAPRENTDGPGGKQAQDRREGEAESPCLQAQRFESRAKEAKGTVRGRRCCGREEG